MAYGTQVNINGVDMVSIIDPMIFLDVFQLSSGSRTYAVPTGYTLQYLCGVNANNTQPNISINGGTISWSNGSTMGYIYVFLGR